jgi:hypothetical protein
MPSCAGNGMTSPGARRCAIYYPPMLGPLDWYSAIEIGIAAAVVGIIVLIGWWQDPATAWLDEAEGGRR